MWNEIDKEGLIDNVSWPHVEPEDIILSRKVRYLHTVRDMIRASYSKKLILLQKKSGVSYSKAINTLEIIVCKGVPVWMQQTLNYVRRIYRENNNTLPGISIRYIPTRNILQYRHYRRFQLPSAFYIHSPLRGVHL